MRTTCASMDIIDEQQAVIQPLDAGWYEGRVAAVDMLRLDLLHAVISGNKWFKLKKNVAYALTNGYQTILTFGGAYSNHLVATAAAAKAYRLQSVGIVRGLHAADALTNTLQECIAYGMRLHFETRTNYERKNDAGFQRQLSEQYVRTFVIPEGGANQLGREGAGEIAKLIPESYTHICLPVGTATTFTGLRNAMPLQQVLYGFAPMKQGRYLEKEIEEHVNASGPVWQLFDDWHLGGFGKHSPSLVHFMNEFYEINQVPLDIVYTAKMMYGVKEMIVRGRFDSTSRILCIHTGGLQGNSSITRQLCF